MFWASRAALPFAAFAFLAGLGWLFLFPIATISQGKMGCRSTHVEENALPKLYRPPGSSAEALLNPALQALQHIEDSNGYDMDTLSAWVADLLRGITRDVRVEADECADGSRVRNVIAIIRGSGRSSNSEAFVIAAEVMLTNFNSTSLRAHPLAAALRAGDTLARAKWLAKDAYIVIGVSASGCRCSPAPFGGCAYADSSAIVPWAVSVGGMSRSPNRPATVRGAIVLDWSPSWVLSERARMALFLPAPYGRLPDLDIMTLIMQRSRIPVTFSPDSDCSSSLPPESYAGKLFGLLSFMASVAVGPYKSHSVFLSNNVDALTLSVVPPCPSDTRRGVVDGITEAVKAVELFGNAISTVEERLHASFYFYFLLSPNSYVSLGEYYYTAALMCIVPAVCCMLTSVPSRMEFFLVGLTAFVRRWGCVVILCVGASFGCATMLQVDESGTTALALSSCWVVLYVLASSWAVSVEPEDTQNLSVLLFLSAFLVVVPLVPYTLINFPTYLLIALLTTPTLWTAALSLRIPNSTFLKWFARMTGLILQPGVAILWLTTRYPSRLGDVFGNPISEHSLLASVLIVPVHTVLATVSWRRTRIPKVKSD